MGQIAQDIADGFQCSWCGVVFEDEHGYPVACDDCWETAIDDLTSDDRVEYEDGEIISINEVQKHMYAEL